MTPSTATRPLGEFPLTKLFLLIGGINVAVTAVNAVITLICEHSGPSALVRTGTPISSILSFTLCVLAVQFRLTPPFRSRKCYRHMDCTDLLVIRCLLTLLGSIGLLLVLRTSTVPTGSGSPSVDLTVHITIHSVPVENGTQIPLASDGYNQTAATLDDSEGRLIDFKTTVGKAVEPWGASMSRVILDVYGLSGLLFLFQSLVAGVFWTCWARLDEVFKRIAAITDQEQGKTLDGHPATKPGSSDEKCGECSGETWSWLRIVVLYVYKGALAWYMMFTVYALVVC